MMNKSMCNSILFQSLFFSMFLCSTLADEKPEQSNAKIIERPQTITKNEGENVTIPCAIQDLTQADVVMWYRGLSTNLYFVGAQRTVPNTRYSRGGDESNQVMEIHNLSVSDADKYRCQVNSRPENSVVHTLIVRQRPTIISYSPQPPSGVIDVEFQEDSSAKVTLSCVAQGNPEPSITWYHKPLADDDEKRVVGRENELNFTHIDPKKDSGTYICEASNELGQTENSFNLNIKYKPMIEVDNPIMHAGKGANTVLICRVYSNPEPVVEWTRERDSKTIKNSEGNFIVKKISRNEASLVIKSTTDQDFDNYTCIARNSVGLNEGRIEVVGTPSKPRILSRDREYSIMPQYTVEWEVISNYDVTGYRLQYRLARFNDTTDVPGEWTVIEIPAYDNDLSPIAAKQERSEFVHKRRYTIEDLKIETNYELQIQAENMYGKGRPSDLFPFSVYLPSHQGFSGSPSLSTFLFLPLLTASLATLLMLRQNYY